MKFVKIYNTVLLITTTPKKKLLSRLPSGRKNLISSRDIEEVDKNKPVPDVSLISNTLLYTGRFYQILSFGETPCVFVAGNMDVECKFDTPIDKNTLEVREKKYWWTIQQYQTENYYVIRPKLNLKKVLTYNADIGLAKLLMAPAYSTSGNDSLFTFEQQSAFDYSFIGKIISKSGITLGLSIRENNVSKIVDYNPILEVDNFFYFRAIEEFDGEMIEFNGFNFNGTTGTYIDVSQTEVFNRSNATVYVTYFEQSKYVDANIESISTANKQAFNVDLKGSLAIIGVNYGFENSKAETHENSTEATTIITINIQQTVPIMPWSFVRASARIKLSTNGSSGANVRIKISRSEPLMWKTPDMKQYFEKYSEFPSSEVLDILRRRNRILTKDFEIYEDFVTTSVRVRITGVAHVETGLHTKYDTISGSFDYANKCAPKKPKLQHLTNADKEE